jgi:hypothetical protein
MKNQKCCLGTLSVLLGLLLLGGCSGVFGPENNEPEGITGQEVTFFINTPARTLLPNTPVFDKYSLSFTANEGQAEPEENPVELDGDSESIMLAPGSWTVTAKGLVHLENVPGIADGYYEGAVSEPVDFSVGFTGSNTVNITITGGIQAGVKGLFSYAVSFPEDVIGGELRILNLEAQPVTGLNPVDLIPTANRSGTMTLDPGYYLLQVELENADHQYAYKTEILHIYSSLTTTADDSNGYVFTAANFAPMTDLSGQVILSTSPGLDPQVTLSLYRDNGYTNLIESPALGETGSWNAKISSYYTSVYLKATVDYDGYTQLVLTKGPVALASTTATDWEIDAQLLDLSGTVQLDAAVAIETGTTPTLSLYSDSTYASLIETADVDTGTGAWNLTILPVYSSVYLKAAVDYDGYAEFEKTKGPVVVTSTTTTDWEIDARLLHLSGTVQLDTEVAIEAGTTPTLSLYSDSTYTNADLIETVNINTDTGAWNHTMLPEYSSVYLKATVDYDGYAEFEKRKGPVVVTSTTAADWIIDAGLINLNGTVQFNTSLSSQPLSSKNIHVYSDAERTSPITTIAIANDGSWSSKIPPLYSSLYLKGELTYNTFSPLTVNRDVSVPPPLSVDMDMLYYGLQVDAAISDGTVTITQGLIQGIAGKAGETIRLRVERPDSSRLVIGSLKYNTTAIHDFSPWTFTMPEEDVTVYAQFEARGNAVAYMGGQYYDDLQTAINSASGKVIWIYSDISLTTGITIQTGCTLQSLEGETHTISRGFTGGSLFTVSPWDFTLGADNNEGTLIIDGMKGSYPDSGGPLVNVLEGNFYLRKGAVLQNNKHSGDGGAIYSYFKGNGFCYIYGGEITGNEAARGGGIFAQGPSPYYNGQNFWMTGGSINNNTATNTNGGGGVYAAGLTCQQQGGAIVDNIPNGKINVSAYDEDRHEWAQGGWFKSGGTLQNP